MAQAVIFHARSEKGFLFSLHPALKLLCLISLSILESYLPLSALLSIFVFLIIISLLIKLPFSLMKRSLFFFSVLSLLILVTEYADKNDIRLALIPFFKFTNILIGSLILTDTTMPSDMARGIGSFLSPLLGKYAWKFASAVELTMAMLPLITDTALGVYEARVSRGERIMRHPIRFLVGYSICLLLTLLDKVSDYADALSAREYDNTRERRLYRGVHKEEVITTLFLILFGGITVWINLN